MVQKLNDAGVPPNQIIQLTAHKNINSLNNYSSVNEAQQRDYSRTMNSCAQKQTLPLVPFNYPNPAPVPTPPNPYTITETQAPKPSACAQPASTGMLAGFFTNSQISGNIHVHLNSSNTQSNTSCVKTQYLHSPPPSPLVKRQFKRIKYIPSDSESD